METSILNLLEFETASISPSFIDRFCSGSCNLLLPFKSFKNVADYVCTKYSRVVNFFVKFLPFGFKANRMNYLLKLIKEKFGDVSLEEALNLLTDSVFYICIPAPIRLALKCTVLFSESLIILADTPTNLNTKIWLESLIQLFESLTEQDVSFIQYMRHASREWLQENPEFVKDVVLGAL